MKKILAIAVMAAATLAGSAQAQVCASYPTVDNGFSLGGRIDFPDDLDSFGVEGSYNARGPLSVFAGLNVISLDGADSEGEDVYFAGLAFETPQLASTLGPQFSVCPQARVQYLDTEIGSFVDIPVGLGIGATLATSPGGATISPYVIPQVVFSRFNSDSDPGVDADGSDTNFGVRGGALVTLGMFYVGGEVNFLAADNSDSVFGLRAGVRF